MCLGWLFNTDPERDDQMNAFLRRMYKYHFVSECFDIDSIVDDGVGNFLSCCFPQPTVYILYSLQSKVIRTGSALETTTCSFQSATVLVASLLLYVAFFDLNRFSSVAKVSATSFTNL